MNFSSLYQSLIHLAFPAKCIHCQAMLPPGSIVLCAVCVDLLDFIQSEERCSTCFRTLQENSPLCHECMQLPSLYFRMGAAFDYTGPAASLISHLKYRNRPSLAKGMAGFLVGQFDRLQWPLPDALVPVPLSFSRSIERGYNQSSLLAEEMGAILQCPVWHPLKRQSGDFSQSSLSLEQRKGLEAKRFKLNPKVGIEGKVLLVIDDLMVTGSTLRCCAEVLSSGNCNALYALTFCR